MTENTYSLNHVSERMREWKRDEADLNTNLKRKFGIRTFGHALRTNMIELTQVNVILGLAAMDTTGCRLYKE